jgi:hypothetical protein
MDRYYLQGEYTMEATSSSAVIPLGTSLDAAPTIFDVKVSNPGVSVQNVVAGASSLAVSFDSPAPAGTVLDWMVTSEESIRKILQTNVVAFNDLDSLEDLTGTDQTLVVRAGIPFRNSVGDFNNSTLAGVRVSGSTEIEAGAEEVSVVFEKPFTRVPQIAATPLHLDPQPELMVGVITAVSVAGFTYSLSAEAPVQASLMWIAAVNKAPVVYEGGGGESSFKGRVAVFLDLPGDPEDGDSYFVTSFGLVLTWDAVQDAWTSGGAIYTAADEP